MPAERILSVQQHSEERREQLLQHQVVIQAGKLFRQASAAKAGNVTKDRHSVVYSTCLRRRGMRRPCSEYSTR